MTYADILALPSDPNPRLIHASDTGAYYIIAAGAAGSTATVVGNATVPDDAPIQPAQAFVDNIAKFADPQSQLDVSNQSITKLNASLFAAWLRDAPNYIEHPQINLSGNALTLTNVNSILSAGAEIGFAFILDISGGTNAAPQLPVLVMDISSVSVASGNSYGTCRNSASNVPTLLLDFDSLYGALADSTIAWDGDAPTAAIQVGVIDDPTKQQIIDHLVAIGGGKITDLGGLQFQIVLADHLLEPITFDAGVGGQLTQGNNLVGTLLSYGWTVTTN